MEQAKRISEKRQQLINEIEFSSPKFNEEVTVSGEIAYGVSNKNVKGKVTEINPDGTFTVVVNEYGYNKKTLTLTRDQIQRDSFKIGACPFDERYNTLNVIAYDLRGIISSLDLDKREAKRDRSYVINGITVAELNWNPYVYDKNKQKQYYQRDFVWRIEEKQLLIESIYKGINCGLILVREHSWNKIEKLTLQGETEVAFKDIVDGKQRLNAIQGFINNEYPDLHGNYFDDLSDYAQYKFNNHQLFQFAVLKDNTTDDEVIYQFLKVNFSGIPQSKEHILFVENIGKILK